MNYVLLIICLVIIERTLCDSIISRVSNKDMYQRVTCDFQEDLCETYLVANLTINSTNMTFMLEDTNQSIFLDNIALRYAIVGSSPYVLYDGDFQEENIKCVCNSGFVPEQVCPSSLDFRQTAEGFKILYADYPNTTVCTTPTNGICCRRAYLKNIRTYRVYTNLTSRFDALQFSYKRQFYSISFLSNSAFELLDMNFTWTASEQWIFPTDNLALLVDQDNGTIISTRGSNLNGPQEYNLNKAGWWHGISQAKAWMSNQPATITANAYNLTLPRITQTSIPFVTRTECDNSNFTSLDDPDSYTILVKRATIVGSVYSFALDYVPEITETRNISILTPSQKLYTLCVSYPYVCICDNSTQKCLDIETFIYINNSEVVYLRGQFLYKTSKCSSPNFWTFREPLSIQARIESKNVIPKYKMSECNVQWKKVVTYTSTVTFINILFSSSCVFLPCKLTDSNGEVQSVNLTRTENSISWFAEFSWINLTCGSWNDQIIISSTPISTPWPTPTPTPTTEPNQTETEPETGPQSGTESLDSIQYLIWGLLTIEFGGIPALMSWSVLFLLFVLGVNYLGRNKTLLLAVGLILVLWINGIAFMVIVIALLNILNYYQNPMFRTRRFAPEPPQLIIANNQHYNEME